MSAETPTLDFDKLNGLIPAIAQDHKTKEVLMLGFMNKEAWQKTVQTKLATYYSRSRGSLWVKGETSGHYQEVQEIYIDCDNDTVLLSVKQIGGVTCHEGFVTCFFKKLKDGELQHIGRKPKSNNRKN